MVLSTLYVMYLIKNDERANFPMKGFHSPTRKNQGNGESEKDAYENEYWFVVTALPRRTPSLLVEHRVSSSTCSRHRGASTNITSPSPSIATPGLFSQIPEDRKAIRRRRKWWWFQTLFFQTP